MMELKYFNKKEAQAKIGKRVKSLVNFPGVSSETKGQVVKFDIVFHGYCVAISWDLPNTLIDWVDRNSYQKFIQEIN